VALLRALERFQPLRIVFASCRSLHTRAREKLSYLVSHQELLFGGMRLYDVLVLLEQHAHAKPDLRASFSEWVLVRVFAKQIAHIFPRCMFEQTSIE
jgi:hypothetical protein